MCEREHEVIGKLQFKGEINVKGEFSIFLPFLFICLGMLKTLSKMSWLTPRPSASHIVLNELMLKSRTIVVGDIHGCLQEFEDLLTKCKYDPTDSTLILVGDLVNKGPYSAETVQYARSLGAYCVRGNHDDSALSHALGIHPRARDESYDYLEKLTRY